MKTFIVAVLILALSGVATAAGRKKKIKTLRPAPRVVAEVLVP